MPCTRCRIRTAVTDDGLCTFCSGTRPPPPDDMTPRATRPGGWGVGDWPRSPVGLSWAVTALLGTVIATDLVAIGTGLHLRSMWQGLADAGDTAAQGGRVQSADQLHDVVTDYQPAVFLATGILFVLWFHRTRRNAEVFDLSVQKMGPGWAVGGWFVPVANLWFPYRVADGIWTGSAPIGPEGGRVAVPRALLNFWWALWVASLLSDQITAQALDDAEKPEQFARGLGLVAVADAVEIVAAVLAILFVRALTRMQVERAAHVPAPAPAVPGAHG
ncbi:DUF4328 domain-containing protein [Streptomyces sp. ISL-112]|uniref:DUF4328 domain-containing protein n=1 Tax=unclassified Streptomyces TaxID=2593676 RepID=UPI001BE86380|nr:MULTISPECIES: DUF4328 domain-containing protein [unclassified Streptomyces]MBT2424611.1 DUF4328 domain-containing protein [Streptomyces sp. ISL-112]MBT2465146.1 DUF4328 domain-containing protein [Streptomyces sp. ISL-63]